MKNAYMAVKNFLKYILLDWWIDKQVEAGKLERQQLLGTGDGIKKSTEDVKQMLETFTIKQVAQGWRVNAQTDKMVVLEYGKKPNHILHFLLCFPTLGLWLIVWILLSMSMTIKRKTFVVNEFGVIQQTA